MRNEMKHDFFPFSLIIFHQSPYHFPQGILMTITEPWDMGPLVTDNDSRRFKVVTDCPW